MGQKAILSTLKETTKNLTSSLIFKNSKFLKTQNNLTLVVTRLLLIKKVLVIKKTISTNCNKLVLNLSIYYRNSKVNNLKKKLKDDKVLGNSAKKFFETLLKNNAKMHSDNFIQIKLSIINQYLNKKLVSIFYLRFKRFEKILFSRRSEVFLDFIKLTSLLYCSFVPVSSYLTVLTDIFKFLPKSLHSRFFLLVKVLINILTKNVKTKKLTIPSDIKGIKLNIKGKLKGKLRKSSISTQKGRVPSQSINHHTEFSRLHVTTRIGVFGFRLWILKKKTN